jgi:hypothetical protein
MWFRLQINLDLLITVAVIYVATAVKLYACLPIIEKTMNLTEGEEKERGAKAPLRLPY